jgi:hypothetical protein
LAQNKIVKTIRDYKKIACKISIIEPLRVIQTGTVIIQAMMIFRNRLQSTAFFLTVWLFSDECGSGSVRPLTHPTRTTEPTMQCVVEIGRPNLLANKTVVAAPNSITKPLEFKPLLARKLSRNLDQILTLWR